jgi:hypothetical protein
MKTIARFTPRPGDPQGALVLGYLFEHGKQFLKQGRVYEIQEFLGELIIKDIGPSAMEIGPVGSSFYNHYPNWYSGVDAIVTDGRHLLTQDEYDSYHPNHKNRGD